MREYTIHFRDGQTKEFACENKGEIIDHFFKGDENSFKANVTMLNWTSQGMHFTENVSAEKIDASLISADANPYGWRK